MTPDRQQSCRTIPEALASMLLLPRRGENEPSRTLWAGGLMQRFRAYNLLIGGSPPAPASAISEDTRSPRSRQRTSGGWTQGLSPLGRERGRATTQTATHRHLERLVVTAGDDERRRIGADLHDGLGQQLTGLACLGIALHDRLKSTCPTEAEQAGLIARLANEAMTQARALARGLCAIQLDQVGLPAALRDLADQSGLLFRITCRLRCSGAPPPGRQAGAIHLYRIAQEAIHNAVRHGNASRVFILLIIGRRRSRLVVRDDGCGFDAVRQRNASSGGLQLMRYRASAIGAEFSLQSTRGSGTRVACTFPHLSNETHPSSATDGCDAQASHPARR